MSLRPRYLHRRWRAFWGRATGRGLGGRLDLTGPMVVRANRPWVPFALGAGLLLSCTISLGLYSRLQSSVAASGELSRLLGELDAQSDELARLRSAVGTGRNAANIERVVQQKLMAQIHALESENAALKEDLVFFERSIPSVDAKNAVRIDAFRVGPGDQGRFRYRLLLVSQPERQGAEFKGRLELIVRYALAGKDSLLVLPAAAKDRDAYQISSRFLLRKEGGFELPAGARLLAVEARVFQGDTLRAERSAQL